MKGHGFSRAETANQPFRALAPEVTAMPKWIPKRMEWFLAELIQQFTFANGDGPLIWVNTVLIKPNSLEEAYDKALARGELYKDSFLNTDQEQVTTTFRGIHDLFLIYEDLDDGAELLYYEENDLSEEDIAAMVTPKEKLACFLTHGPETEEAAPKQEEALP